MGAQRHLAAGAGLASAIGLALPSAVMADASPDPASVGSNVGQPDSSLLALALGLLALVASIALVAKGRPTARRSIRAVAILTFGGLFGLLTVLAGLFSDWSGLHRINWPLVIGGGAIVMVSLGLSVWIARAGRGSVGEPPL